MSYIATCLAASWRAGINDAEVARLRRIKTITLRLGEADLMSPCRWYWLLVRASSRHSAGSGVMPQAQWDLVSQANAHCCWRAWRFDLR